MPENLIITRLKEVGIRATAQRVSLLTTLAEAGKPMTVLGLARATSGHADLATAYRALRTFEEKGLVRRVDLRQNGASFEYEDPATHHHHVVCTRCGRVAAIDACDFRRLRTDALASTGFFRITGHTIELFGVCGPCAARAS